MTQILLALLGLFAGTTHATVYYVATTGSDSNNGTSIATPLRHVAFATGLALPGDVIEIRAGSYAERVIISRPAPHWRPSPCAPTRVRR